jgi:hypothetical protein
LRRAELEGDTKGSSFMQVVEDEKELLLIICIELFNSRTQEVHCQTDVWASVDEEIQELRNCSLSRRGKERQIQERQPT